MLHLSPVRGVQINSCLSRSLRFLLDNVFGQDYRTPRQEFRVRGSRPRKRPGMGPTGISCKREQVMKNMAAGRFPNQPTANCRESDQMRRPETGPRTINPGQRLQTH